MSYRQLCSTRGVGFLETGFSFSEVKASGITSVTQANAQAVNQAIDKMSVPAFAAGPISKAEQDAVGLLIQEGAAGRLPTPAQFANILTTAGVTVVAGAAAAACGPAAPLCGAAAGYVTSSILGTITGSGSGCGTKINGMCDSDYWAAYRAKVLAKCPPGSQACRDRLNDFWFKKMPALTEGERVASDLWTKKCTNVWVTNNVGIKTPGQPPASCFEQCPEPRSTFFGSDSACVQQNRSKGPVRKAMNMANYMTQEETRILLESRYKAEYEYITTVDAQTKALQDKVVPQCRTAGCKSQVKGILGEGAFEAAQLLRSPTGGKALADRAMQQAMLQADGAIQQSRQVSKLQTDADTLKAEAAASRDTTRKVILGLAAVAVVATGAAIYLKKRRR